MKKRSNNNRRSFLLLLATMLFSLLSGCAREKILPPDEVATAFYGFYIYGDTTNIQKLGVAEADIQPTLDAKKTATQKVLKENFKKAKLPITTAQLDAIYDAQLTAYRKLTCTTILNDSTKDTAAVTLTTNYINLATADQAAADTISKIIASDKLTERDNKKIAKLYVDEMIKNFKAVKPSDKKTTVTIPFAKEKVKVGDKVKTIWMPKDTAQFGTDLGNAVNSPVNEKK